MFELVLLEILSVFELIEVSCNVAAIFIESIEFIFVIMSELFFEILVVLFSVLNLFVLIELFCDVFTA
mgnify:FL=1